MTRRSTRPPTSIHDLVHGSAETSSKPVGGAGGARTHDRRIMRSTAPSTVPASCTDDTENGTDGTHHAGIIPRAIPRTLPRPRRPRPPHSATVRNIAKSDWPTSARGPAVPRAAHLSRRPPCAGHRRTTSRPRRGVPHRRDRRRHRSRHEEARRRTDGRVRAGGLGSLALGRPADHAGSATALREARSRALGSLPAPIPHESAAAAPKTLGFSAHSFHDSFHAHPFSGYGMEPCSERGREHG